MRPCDEGRGGLTYKSTDKRGRRPRVRLVVSSRVGRPREDGPRYPSGKLKPTTTRASVTPAAWARIRTDMVKASGDARLASEVGRLSFHGLLTDRQAATAFRIGEIYGAFERHKRKNRSSRSPSYEMGFGGEGIAEELMSTEALENLEAQIRAAESAFLELQDILEDYPSAAIAALEQLCVENCAINSTYLPHMGRLLDRVAAKLTESVSKKRRQRQQRVPSPAPAQTPPRTPAPGRGPDDDKAAWFTFMRAVRPDLDTMALNNAYDLFLAMKDRQRFRLDKVRPHGRSRNPA